MTKQVKGTLDSSKKPTVVCMGEWYAVHAWLLPAIASSEPLAKRMRQTTVAQFLKEAPKPVDAASSSNA